VTALVLPLAAAGLWGGILVAGLGDEVPEAAAVAVMLTGGVGAVAGAAWWHVTERRRQERDHVVAYLWAAAGSSSGATPERSRHNGSTTHRITAAVALAVAFGLIGAGWGALRRAHVSDSPLSFIAGHLVRIDGSLATDPDRTMTGWTAIVRAEVVTPTVYTSAGSHRIHDGVWINGRGRVPALSSGDRVSVEGMLAPLRDSFGRYLAGRGIPATLSVDRIRLLGPPTNPALRAATALRQKLGDSLLRVLPAKEAGLVMGLTLGDTSRLDPDVEEDFRATGLSHLTAVSGENVAMFLAPILAVTGLLRLGRRSRLLIGVSAVVFFVVLTRGEPSVLRAAVMAGLTMLGVFLGRPRSPPAIMGGAVLILLAFDPTLVYSIGFQLSVAATAGMALLTGPLSARMGFLPGPIGLAAAATLGAQAGVTPVILYHFGAVPTVTLPANVLAFPAVSPGMLFGLAAGAIGLVSEPVGHAVGLLAVAPLRYLETLADRLARSPFPSITSATGRLALLALGIAVVGAFGWWIRRGARLSRRAVVIALLVLPGFVWANAVRAGTPDSLQATFFEVGWGDGAVVRSPGGATILIDGGADLDLVATKLAALGIRRIDVMVATHPHADHIAGLAAVLARYPTGLVVDPGCPAESPYYAAFLRAVKGSGVPFRHPRPPERLRVGDVILSVLGPQHCFVGTDSDPNNDSVVLHVSAAGGSVLFTGDVEEPAQAELLARYAHALPAQVLKVPHHGGNTNLPAFLAATRARVAVVSVGPNRYGHPVPSVLATLRRDGMNVYRTDRAGDVTVEFDHGRLLIESERG
jgi:DNA internalization-related competence protein ComEC/Rec2